MIRCVKCGKLYNYEKTNGICPNCARYNRPDSSELEQDLHERYDSTPNIHSEQEHEEAHRRNYDRSSHRTDEYGAQQYSYQDMMGNDRKRPRKKRRLVIAVVLSVVVVLAVIGITFCVMLFNAYRDFVEEESRPYVEYDYAYIDDAYTLSLGIGLSEEDWEDWSSYLTEEELEALKEELPQESGTCYLLEICVMNGSSETLDMTDVTEEDITICLNGEQMKCLMYTNDSYDEIEAGDYAYVECVFCLPDDYELSGDGYAEVSVSMDIGTDEPMEYSFDDYFSDDDEYDYDYDYDYDYEDSYDDAAELSYGGQMAG